MSESNYVTIQAEAADAAEETPSEPFRFILRGKKFEVPKLAPETVPAGLFSVAAREFPTEVEKIGAFLYELFEWRPDIGRELKRLPIPYATELLTQWTEYSNVDPKAKTSSS